MAKILSNDKNKTFFPYANADNRLSADSVGQHSPKRGAQCLCQRIYGREPAKFFATRSEVFHVKRHNRNNQAIS